MNYLKIDEARKQIDKENQEMIQTSKGGCMNLIIEVI